jgi:FAD/FMN-containing dehydrogenase
MGRPMDRRQFLRRVGSLGLVMGSTAVGASCSRTPSAIPRASTTTTTFSGPPNWSQLAQSLSGQLVLPADPTYGTVKLLYNEQFDNIDPAAVALCASPSDVQRCVVFAREHGLPVAARSGGHSYGGYSLTSGLVVDVSSMSDIAPSALTARIGAGARLIDIYDTLGNAGVVLPGGSCPTVGIAGLTLGGGIGVVDRLFGLTCDNLRSVDIVLADGSLVTASGASNSDLFWACQGGGGGNFGIATSFDFGVHPVPSDIALFTLEWPWAAAADVLGSWLSWISSIPDELWSNCQLTSGGSALEVRVGGVFAGTATTLASLLSPLESSVGVTATDRFVGPESYLDAMFIEAGCEGLSVGECHLPTQTSDGTLSRSAYSSKSAFVTEVFPSAGLSAAVDAVASSQQIAPGLGAALAFDSYGGAINAVAPSATAFVHRNAIAGIQMTATWGSGPEPPDASSWLASAAGALAPYTSGAYQNYIDPTLEDWQQAYYGANLARLVKVKAAVDPDDFFHFAQSIPTSLAS